MSRSPFEDTIGVGAGRPATVEASALQAARALLAGLSRRSLNGRVFGQVAERADEPLLPSDVAVADTLTYLGHSDALEAAFAPAGRRHIGSSRFELVMQSPAQELREAASSLSSEVLLALDVLLRRALDPLGALSTWPVESVFQPREAELVERLRCEGTASPTTGRAGVTLIVKLTRLCNLRCAYCHDWAAGPGHTMPLSVVATLFRKALAASSHVHVDVVWHGGEPTLVKPKRFLQFLWLQAHFRRPGQRINNALQSNGTRMDAAWAGFLARYRFGVGISIDGPAFLHDEMRPNAGGGSTFALVRRGIGALRDAGVIPGILMVVGPRHLELGADKLIAFLRAEGIGAVSLLAMRPAAGEGRPDDPILPVADYIRLLLDVERSLRASPDPPLLVRELQTLKAAMSRRPVAYCEFMGDCAGRYYSIEADGSVSHCDKYHGDAGYTVGNIMNAGFAEFERSPRLAAIRTANREAAASQEDRCRFFGFCRGWCPHERYVAQQGGGDAETGCCGLAPLFEELRPG